MINHMLPRMACTSAILVVALAHCGCQSMKGPSSWMASSKSRSSNEKETIRYIGQKDKPKPSAEELRAKLANAYTSLEWTKANGPDNGVIMMVPGSPRETGNVTVYDSDGTTVLHTSPKVTMRQGDVWQYVP